MTEFLKQDLPATTVGSFLDDLASAVPVPGGGAAAAVAGAMAAALVAMVANLTIGRPRYQAVEATMTSVLEQVEAFRRDLTRLADDDARAYAGVSAAYRLPRANEDERARRNAAIQRALGLAAIPPAEVMEICRGIVPLCLQVAAHGNSNVASDAGIAAELAGAGVRASAINVRVNLADLLDADLVARAEARIRAAELGLRDDLDRVTAIVSAKIARKTTS